MTVSPFTRDWDNKGSDCVFVELPTHAISVSLTTETNKSNIDTSRGTTKQYYKIILFKSFYQMKLTFSESYCQILQTFRREIVPGNTFSPQDANSF